MISLKLPGASKPRLSLSSANADEVIQKRLLLKTPDAESELAGVFAKTGDILKKPDQF